MKSIITILFFLLLLGCSTKHDTNKKEAIEHGAARKYKNRTTEELMYEVVREDVKGDWLQRLFVVIPGDEIHNEEVLQQIIHGIEETYNLDTNSNISFFSHKKYADYKENLFKSLGYGLSKKEKIKYEEWLNEHYLGEYDCGTGVLLIYPCSRKHNKVKSIIRK